MCVSSEAWGHSVWLCDISSASKSCGEWPHFTFGGRWLAVGGYFLYYASWNTENPHVTIEMRGSAPPRDGRAVSRNQAISGEAGRVARLSPSTVGSWRPLPLFHVAPEDRQAWKCRKSVSRLAANPSILASPLAVRQSPRLSLFYFYFCLRVALPHAWIPKKRKSFRVNGPNRLTLISFRKLAANTFIVGWKEMDRFRLSWW